MANQWFRLYAEFATDPKVQVLPEHMQRRLIMLFCLECSNGIRKLSDDELCFALRIDRETLHETFHLFQSKAFIDENRRIINWDKRQYKSDTSTERVKKYRAKSMANKDETFQKRCGNGNVTAPDTDTDTERKKKESLSSFRTRPAPETQEAFELYNETARAAGLPIAQKLTKARLTRMKARLEDCGGLDGWREAMRKLSESEFCTGRVNGWKADLDFVLQEKSFTKLMEGSYDNRRQEDQSPDDELREFVERGRP